MPVPPLRSVLRYGLALVMVGVGIQHFRDPSPFVRIVPAILPAPLMLVYVSGFFEIAGGLGLLWTRSRRLAAYGLIALFVCVFPANVNMALGEIQLEPDGQIPVWAMWARLPVQLVFIAWAAFVARCPPAEGKRPASGADVEAKPGTGRETV